MRTNRLSYGIILAVAMGLLALSGCAVPPPVGESYVRNPPPDPGAIAAIAQDAVLKISSLYPPGHTRLDLVYPGDNRSNSQAPGESSGQSNAQPTAEHRQNDAFSAAIDDGLRKCGFTISPSANVRVAFTLDVLPIYVLTPEQTAIAQPVKSTAKKNRRKGRAEQIPAETTPTLIGKYAWYLRLKLVDADKFELRTITRMYRADGVPVAGFAEQAP
jgi:hypothetical protein